MLVFDTTLGMKDCVLHQNLKKVCFWIKIMLKLNYAKN